MYIKKKNALIIALVCLLVVVGYVNHELTKRSLRETSSDYQQHEENQLMEISKIIDDYDNDEISNEDSETEGDIEIVDSRSDEISDLKKDTDDNIESVITKEESFSSSNYFIEHRLSRDKLRASLIDRLNEIINNDNTNEETREKAQDEIIALGQVAELELSLEGLIKAKGFEDALVFLGDNSARIVVSTNELTEQDVVKILEIVKSETDIEAGNIKIMKKF
ncbi:stage III sporulation protein AH [Proteiniborus sp. DW1]|uniref:SpoIIIAH-like family protein n=1 Tax=Proteiniborus sp. DW1 TaxID=1889883 RepID=UPI00092DF65C|nr:SpoIIIAH-like family protein [Proteiniborus sp. DW1]SCG83310.1 stage III sporulation protein AH [Proteiniborus sp. DW1]